MINENEIKLLSRADLKRLHEVVRGEVMSRRHKFDNAQEILAAAEYMGDFEIDDILEQLNIKDSRQARLCVGSVLRGGGYKNVVLYCKAEGKAIRRWRRDNKVTNDTPEQGEADGVYDFPL